jgi:hypothetical protein
MITIVQYWEKDEARAFRLARLLADFENRPTEDYLVLARRNDCRLSQGARDARSYCNQKFRTLLMVSGVQDKTGHPDGCHGLWAGVAEQLLEMWRGCSFPWADGRTVLMIEADCCPIRRDWRRAVTEAHAVTLAAGKMVTGHVAEKPWPFVQGVFVMTLDLVATYPHLLQCPSGVAWDMCHASTLLPVTRPSRVLRHEYNTRDWTAGVLGPVSQETALIHGCKDDSVERFARSLIEGDSR